MAVAFGFFIIGLYFFVPMAMVFGAAVSATLCKPFHRVIEAMMSVYSFRSDLTVKHRAFLDMISLKPPASNPSTFAKAKSCPINPGVNDSGNRQIDTPTTSLWMIACWPGSAAIF